MLKLIDNAAQCNDEIPYGLPPGDEANGASTGVDDTLLTPTDTGSDEPVEQEDMDVPSPSEEMHLDATLTASRLRVLGQATGAEDVWVKREVRCGDKGIVREWRVTIFYGPHETYAASAADLASAEFMALCEASIADVAAKRAGKAVANV